MYTYKREMKFRASGACGENLFDFHFNFSRVHGRG